MQWIEVTIQTSSAGIELVAARLTALGFDSFIMDDQEEFHDFLENNRQYWDYVDETLAAQMNGISRIRLYLADNSAAAATVRSLRSHLAELKMQFPALDFGPLTVDTAACRDEDWENNWKQFYQPLSIGQRLMIVPQWIRPENPEGRIEVRLDPGMIFGTGAHASTQMCLAALEQAVHGGERAADLGSGSGILSIAALLLGASTAVGVDIDPKAADISRENAALNGLHADRFSAVTGNVIEDRQVMDSLCEGSFDIVLANIVADVILPLCPLVPHLLRQGGVFLCSGILDSRVEEVRRSLARAGLRITGERAQDGWCQLSAALR